MIKYQFNPLFEGKLGRLIDQYYLKQIKKHPKEASKYLRKLTKKRDWAADSIKMFGDISPDAAIHRRDILAKAMKRQTVGI